MAFVVDNSITMAWLFADEDTPFTESVIDRLRDESALVPVIWPLELANALLVGERRRRVTQAQSERFIQLLDSLPITVDVDTAEDAFRGVIDIARAQGLSSYDASYIVLAMREGISLATQDQRLRAAATRVGVPLVR
ncbi:MAG: PIN domain-containing protein [Chloroflexi bacterium]|nr:PIN domain-containing protein [Chloroflexota bacterium]